MWKPSLLAEGHGEIGGTELRKRERGEREKERERDYIFGIIVDGDFLTRIQYVYRGLDIGD